MKLRTLTLIFSASLFVIPTIVSAHTLTIGNHTSYPLTFQVNGTCSPDIGTIYETETKTLSEETFYKLCSPEFSLCEIRGYTGKNCTGAFVGGIGYQKNHVRVIGGDPALHVNVSANLTNLLFTELL